MINIPEDELRDLLIYAFRYALPRHTYATADLYVYLLKYNKKCLQASDRFLICREITKFLDSGDCWDMDRAGWEDILKRFNIKDDHEKNKTPD